MASFKSRRRSGSGEEGAAFLDIGGGDDSSVPGGGAGGRTTSWLPVVLLCAAVAIICSIDRTAMSVAIMPMSQTYGWSASVKGAVSSAFNLGHLITNLYGGYLAARFSPKHVLSAGVVVWSLFTALTPLGAAVQWLPALLLVRAAMGLGEGVAFPTMQAIMKGWVPQDKRSRCLSLIYSGHQIGSILSLLFSPLIIGAAGVNTMFYLYGGLGFVWLSGWDRYVSEAPPLLHSTHGATTPLLPPHGLGGGGSPSGGGAAPRPAPPLRLRDVPWRSFVTTPVFWAILISHSAFGVVYNICIAWLPTYYNQVFAVDVRQSSFLSILPWAAMAIGTNASGWAADALVNRRLLSTTRTRKLLQLMGSIGPGLCLMYLALMPQTGGLLEAEVLLTLTMGSLGLCAGGFASNHQDIATKYAPVLFGITNAGASLAGSVCVFGVGVLLDGVGSWSLIFQLVALLNFGSAAFYLVFATSEPTFD